MDESAGVQHILTSLELTEGVLGEAVKAGCETMITHHPLLFSPVSTLVESRPRERLLRGLVANERTLIACHTNLDAAEGGLAHIAGEAVVSAPVPGLVVVDDGVLVALRQLPLDGELPADRGMAEPEDVLLGAEHRDPPGGRLLQHGPVVLGEVPVQHNFADVV